MTTFGSCLSLRKSHPTKSAECCHFSESFPPPYCKPDLDTNYAYIWSLRLLRAYPINTGQNLLLKWNAEHPSLFVPHIISSLARLTQWLFSISVCPLFITSATCATAPWCKETDGGHHDSGQARLPSSKKAADFEMESFLQTQHFLAYPIYHSKP